MFKNILCIWPFNKILAKRAKKYQALLDHVFHEAHKYGPSVVKMAENGIPIRGDCGYFKRAAVNDGHIAIARDLILIKDDETVIIEKVVK